MKYNDFGTCLEMGERGEELTRSKFHDIFKPVVQKFIYGDSIHSTAKQRRGIDFEISKEKIDFDVKCRNYDIYRYKDILLETISVVENGTPGWLITSKSDLVVYTWFNQTKTTFIDGYLLYLDNIRKFVDGYVPEKKQIKYAKSQKNGYTWTTENIAVPISDFPGGCLDRINMKKLFPPKASSFEDFTDGDDECWQAVYKSNRVELPD